MRKNLLNPIHKALRAICYDTARHLQQTNFQDAEENAAAMVSLRRTLSLLDLHIAHETDLIHPLIKNFNIDLHRPQTLLRIDRGLQMTGGNGRSVVGRVIKRERLPH